MRYLKSIVSVLVIATAMACSNKPEEAGIINTDNLMIRMAEIEIDSAYLSEYLAILKEESAASVALEPGVISIYPMFQKENPTQIRLLEIYADKVAYEAHLETPHFKKYKTETMHMVKSLALIDMAAIDPESMPRLFSKLPN
ncbi:putative quinol monooxygenase [Roseivirga pacifica]|uniref:putative quinol monooxygenase n=1 Tax=Roseivirga pacifica TaxID=1267423 RepID=UPI003BAAE941